jgi:hypothetical protein
VVSTGRRNTLSWAGRDGMRAEKRMMSSGAHTELWYRWQPGILKAI